MVQRCSPGRWRQRDGLGVRVRVDGEGADVAEVGLLHELGTTGLEQPHVAQLAVDEDGHVVGHRMDAVLDDGRALVGLAAVDVHDVDRGDGVEQVVGAVAGEHVGQPRRVPDPDDRADARFTGGLVEVELGEGGVEVVAHVDEVDTGPDRRRQHRRAEPVEGPDAAHRHVGASEHRGERGRVRGVDRGGRHAGSTGRGADGLRHGGGVGGPQVGHHHLVHVLGQGHGPGRHRPDTAAPAQHHDLRHRLLPRSTGSGIHRLAPADARSADPST
ncbi:MAG: hypothetical protein R2726_09355 [Acidimicrobiales bacterium]